MSFINSQKLIVEKIFLIKTPYFSNDLETYEEGKKERKKNMEKGVKVRRVKTTSFLFSQKVPKASSNLKFI